MGRKGPPPPPKAAAPLIDAHTHLDDERFEEGAEVLVARALEAGVVGMLHVVCARQPRDVEEGLRLARRFPGRVYAVVGCHPHDARHYDDALEAALREAAASPEVVAIGETGLDFHYDHAPRNVQREVFERQAALAREVGKPLVVHSREAPEETLDVLASEDARACGGQWHCFSEGPEEAARALDLGFLISFSGVVTFPRRTESIQEAARTVPLDGMLLETDAPYLTPVPRRGRRNEPAFVAHTADFVAGLRAEPPERVCRAATENARRVFRLPPP